MKKAFLLIASVIIPFLTPGCKKEDPEDSLRTIEVIINDVPYPTEKYLRIGYTLKMWEFMKEGLLLNEIIVIDDDTKAELMTIGKESFGNFKINPLNPVPFLTQDQITSYYLSVQLPIPLGQEVPTHISHRFNLRDTVNNTVIDVEGGLFSPRTSESPMAILSPVKGTGWLFINQSTMAYHYNATFFIDGQIYSAEQYAFDNVQLDENLQSYTGDPAKSESYFNYGDTLYAVAGGSVQTLVDGRPENNGNAKNITFNSPDEYGGNYLILDMGANRFAVYCHCVPGSFLVKSGDVVTEGQPLALLGNSGNSTEPHLHFQICDKPDLFFAKGLPFVLKKYTKIGELTNPTMPVPLVVTNSMMESLTLLRFD